MKSVQQQVYFGNNSHLQVINLVSEEIWTIVTTKINSPILGHVFAEIYNSLYEQANENS